MSPKIPDLGKNFLSLGQEQFLRHISVDLVIFGFHEGELKVLLLRWKDGPWCLPGGFVGRNESLDKAAHRTLHERTQLSNLYLQQFYAFGEPGREGAKVRSNPAFKDTWLAERFITIGYYALVEYSKVQPVGDAFSQDCRWFDVQSLPKLLYDHNKIVDAALNSLRESLTDHPVGYNLLAAKFTMPELQRLYEAILGRAIDRRNFQKKMLATGWLIRLKERKTGGAHKAPYLYRFDKKRYERALKQGLMHGF